MKKLLLKKLFGKQSIIIVSMSGTETETWLHLVKYWWNEGPKGYICY